MSAVKKKVEQAIWDAFEQNLPPLTSIKLTRAELYELRNESEFYDWSFEPDFEGRCVPKYCGVTIVEER